MSTFDGETGLDLRYNEKLDLLTRIVDLAVSAVSQDELVQQALDVTLEFLGAKVGSILFYDEINQHLYVRHAKGLPEDLAGKIRVKVGDGISGWVAQHRKPLLIADIEKDPVFGRISNSKYETRSLISAPLTAKGRLIGVLNVNNKTDGTSFGEGDLSLLTSIAHEIAIALENFHLMESLQKKAEVLEAANERLVEMGQMKADFLSRVSHELRTPLNSIKGAAYYLLNSKGYAPDTLREFLQIITDESNRLIRMIDDLLDLSKLEEKEDAVNKVEIDIVNVLTDLVALFTPQASERGIEIETEFPAKNELVLADKDRITQLFTNIISNGVKYTSRGGKITVTVADDDENLHVTIADTGDGIPEEDLPYIFDKYKTVGSADAEVSRTGLGLYISRKIVELHGGRIDVESRVGEGTTFTVVLEKREKGDYQKDLKKTLDLLTTMISEVMQVRIASLMLVDERTDELTIRSAQGLDEATVANTRLKVGDKIAGWVALEGRPLLIEDVEKDLTITRKSINQYRNKSLLSVPVKAGGRVIGVLNVNNKVDGAVFNEADMELCTVLAERVAMVLQKVDRYTNKEGLLKDMSRALESLVEAKKSYPVERSTGVAEYIFPLLKALELPREECRIIYYASTLYDLGLIRVDDHIMERKGPLTPEEHRKIRKHPVAGLALIEPLEFVGMVKKIILHHHECFDGSGYPDGLAGEDIPMGARVMAVLDSFAAMTRRESYNAPHSTEQALDELKREAGSRYDPVVVGKFLEVVQQMEREREEK